MSENSKSAPAEVFKSEAAQLLTQEIAKHRNEPSPFYKVMGQGAASLKPPTQHLNLATHVNKPISFLTSDELQVSLNYQPTAAKTSIRLAWSATDEQCAMLGLSPEWFQQTVAHLAKLTVQEWNYALALKGLQNGVYDVGASAPTPTLATTLQAKPWPGDDASASSSAASLPPQTAPE